jgi:dipeptidyl aminopeptidase/acylaminoacyl peptidase
MLVLRSGRLWVLLLVAPAFLEAQGSPRNKVFKTTVEPHWFAGGTRFWYRNDLAGGRRRFVLVDAVRARRKPAFDHEKLARALSKASGKKCQADRLPIQRMVFEDAGTAVTLVVAGKAWRCDFASYEVRAVPEGETPVPAGALEARRSIPRASRSGGAETYVTFENRMKVDLELFWVDLEGRRRSYGQLGAGASRRQHTYAGHAWLAVDPGGKVRAAFVARDAEDTAVIAEDSPVIRREPRRRSRRDASPDGKWRAFFKDHNVYLRGLENGEAFPLSRDGSEEDAYGGRVHWSPDGTKLVTVRTKQGADRRVYYVESSPRDQVQPKLHSYEYRKPGDPIPQPKPRLFDVATRRKVPIADELFANPWSITDIRWSPDSRYFTFVYNQRGHQVLRVVRVDAVTGTARAIVDERSDTFIDYANKQYAYYLDTTHEIIWMSERDGWNHLYLYDAETGAVKNRITTGPWVVRGVDRIDEDERCVWFRAGGIRPEQDPYYVHHCRVKLDGTELVVLTEGDGTHQIRFSPDRRYVLDTWSRVDLPPVTELRRSADGTLVCELERADWSALLATGWKPPERFAAPGRDGITPIYGVIFRPTNFDPEARYPVIEEIYAGPHGSFVPKRFRASHKAQSMADLGFVVVKIDGMGTSHRSKKFHDVCWKNLGDSGFPDRIRWIKAAAEKYPFMDTGRVGIYGGSAGGQSALRALLAHGDFYSVAVADCGCHDNRMDKIWWNELWMGWPVGPHYEEQSNVTQAHRLTGKLLLIVGEMDENVDPASTMQVVNALIKADKDFDLLVMPGVGHGAADRPYGRRRRADFFVRHLCHVEPRRE